jgi:hypothetical protein
MLEVDVDVDVMRDAAIMQDNRGEGLIEYVLGCLEYMYYLCSRWGWVMRS